MAMTAKNSVDSVRLEMISDMEITIPQLEEQEKIGNYFQKLDNQIDLQQKELEKLKNIKKASLSKMFV
jgi:type I restriction enzyme S subunit